MIRFKASPAQIMSVCALLLWATGAVMTLANWRGAAATSAALAQARADLAEAEAAALVLEHRRAAMRAYELLPAGQAESLAALSAKHVTGPAPDIREEGSSQLAGGWTARRVRIVFNDAPIARAWGFARDAEALRPPWLVAECALAASRQTGGFARVEFVMETIERSVE